jgi:hypothetical protein
VSLPSPFPASRIQQLLRRLFKGAWAARMARRRAQYEGGAAADAALVDDMEARLPLVLLEAGKLEQLMQTAEQLGGPAGAALLETNPAEHRRRAVATRVLLALDFVVSGC